MTLAAALAESVLRRESGVSATWSALQFMFALVLRPVAKLMKRTKRRPRVCRKWSKQEAPDDA